MSMYNNFNTIKLLIVFTSKIPVLRYIIIMKKVNYTKYYVVDVLKKSVNT